MDRSFLKWAGGKYKLLKTLKESFPNGNRFVEPFVGSGTVFINTNYNEYLLSDINGDLILLFNHIKNEGETFIDFCSEVFDGNTEEEYYTKREKFNITDDLFLKSALFIYLNRHCFNGLCRYNKKGWFNVPFGRYKKPIFPREEMLNFYNKTKNASFICSDFREVFKKVKAGDVVYCDPPYSPILEQGSNFSDYHTDGFGVEEHIELANLADEKSKMGIPILISNHDTDFTRELYKGREIKSYEVSRTISSDINNRKKVKELLVLFGGKFD